MAKFGTNSNCITCWPNLEPILVAILVVKFWTNTSGTTYNWPNLEPMQVIFYLAGEITQVIDSIHWVLCASGNVFIRHWLLLLSWYTGGGPLVVHRWIWGPAPASPHRHQFSRLSTHYRLTPIKEVQFGFAHFVSHFIPVQIFQIEFPFILSAFKYFRQNSLAFNFCRGQMNTSPLTW